MEFISIWPTCFTGNIAKKRSRRVIIMMIAASGRATVALVCLFIGTATPLAAHATVGRQYNAALRPQLFARPMRTPVAARMADLAAVPPEPEPAAPRAGWIPGWVPPTEELQKLVRTVATQASAHFSCCAPQDGEQSRADPSPPV